MRMCHFRAQNGPFVMNNFFWYKSLLLLSATYWPFSLCKMLKKFLQRIQSYKNVSFLGPKWFSCPKQKVFLKKIMNIIFIYWPLSFCKIFEKFFQRIQSYEMHNFWAQNGPFPQMRIFFWKPVNEPFLFHSCLSTCQKSKSDIYLLVKYWCLKNIEISMAKNNFWL